MWRDADFVIDFDEELDEEFIVILRNASLLSPWIYFGVKVFMYEGISLQLELNYDQWSRLVYLSCEHGHKYFITWREKLTRVKDF